MTYSKISVAAIALACMLSGSAVAVSNQPLVWSFQDTGFTANSAQTAVAMRTGQAWPVIFTGDGDAYSLFATPNLNGSNWHQIGQYLFNGSSSDPVVAKTSIDGRVVAARPFGGAVASSNPAGWSYLGSSITAATFDSAGNLWTASGSNVSNLGKYPGTSKIIDMAVAGDGTVGVVDDNGKYYEHSSWIGWSTTGVDITNMGPTSISYDTLRLAFDAQGRPHISALTSTLNGTLYTFDFSTQSGTWQVNGHGLVGGKSAAIASSDVSGATGVAWADSYGVYYGYLDENGQWNDVTVTSGSNFTSDQSVGLTYDYQGLPVISYVQNGTLRLAYDPVPEPATIGLLAMGGLMWIGRRRRAA